MKICVQCNARFQSEGWECQTCHFLPEIKKDIFLFAPEITNAEVGFKEEYFEQLYEIEHKSFWFRSRSELIVWALKYFFPHAKKFFEIGCGNGHVLSSIERIYPEISLYGSEIYDVGLSYAAKRLKRTRLFQMDARKIPFEREFDVIGAFDVLEHIENDGLVLSQLCQATNEGGGVILTVPQHPFLWSKTDEYACHVRRYRSKELKRKVESAGFEVVKITSFVSLLLPLMIVSRFIKRRSQNDGEISPELEVPYIIDLFLEQILSIERVLIKIGLFFPAGGSLLVIARKPFGRIKD